MAQTQHLPALLGSVGLGHLAPRLSQNEIDWETARLMKSSDLADVGMTSQEAALFRAAVARSLGLFTRVNSSNMITPLGASEPVKMSTFARGVKGVDPGALVSYVTTRLGEASDVRPLAKVAPPVKEEGGRWRRGVTLAPEAPAPVQKKAVPPPIPNAWGLLPKPAEPAPAPPVRTRRKIVAQFDVGKTRRWRRRRRRDATSVDVHAGAARGLLPRRRASSRRLRSRRARPGRRRAHPRGPPARPLSTRTVRAPPSPSSSSVPCRRPSEKRPTSARKRP